MKEIMKKIIGLIALVFLLNHGHATTTVTMLDVKEIKVQPRCPWNGLVDIYYEVVCNDPDLEVRVDFSGVDNDSGIGYYVPRTLSGDGANGKVKAGKKRVTWDMRADYPSLNSSSFKMQIEAYIIAPTPAPYMVIDLSGGANAENYSVRYSLIAPDLNNDTCRSSELWLKLILPGTFTMGSPGGELGRYLDETPHSVTLSKQFYLGVFEITQRQWSLVMGTEPSVYKGDFRPVEGVSYDMIRGASIESNFPSDNNVKSSSFMGKLRSKITGKIFDLPTEAQWEYACRAGTSTALNSGKNLISAENCPNMAEVGRFYYNESDEKGGYSNDHTKVGSYLPNAWGLYDMHGNVWEWCLDWYEKYTNISQTDPKGATQGSYRVLRGGRSGSWTGSANDCRSASRNYVIPSHGNNDNGFRLVCPLLVQ